MDEEKKSALPFSEKDIRRVLASTEGRKLLMLLTKEHGGVLSSAAEALKQGDTERAKALLAPVMEQPEAAELVSRINGK